MESAACGPRGCAPAPCGDRGTCSELLDGDAREVQGHCCRAFVAERAVDRDRGPESTAGWCRRDAQPGPQPRPRCIWALSPELPSACPRPPRPQSESKRVGCEPCMQPADEVPLRGGCGQSLQMPVMPRDVDPILRHAATAPPLLDAFLAAFDEADEVVRQAIARRICPY